MALKTYSGGCHCGAVRFQADVDLAKGTMRCNCSLCYKARAWFAFITPNEFRLEKGENALAEYQWTPPGRPAPNLHYRFCKTCGVRAFVTGKDPKGGDVVALAVAALEGTDADELAKSIKYVDGVHNQFGKPPADTRLL
jgi:hypothetical protein